MTTRKKSGVIKAPKKTSVATAAEGADDLSVLHPERRITIAGRAIVMREYGFVEGLRLMPLLEPIIADIEAIFTSGDTVQNSVPPLLATHADALVQLVATAADVDLEWVTSLSLDDGHELVWWWWIVNGPFCVRTAGQRVAVARAAAAAGRTSTPPSSAPATGQPTTSAE